MNTEPGKNKSALDQAKDRFRYGTVRPLTLICTLFVIICVGIMMINSVRDDTERLRVRVTDLSISREKMARERDKLQSEVSIAETDDYIIAKARQLYGYMMPGEMRFVIKNPEALYGGQTIEMYVVEGDQP